MCWRSAVGLDEGPDSAVAAPDDQSPHHGDAQANKNVKFSLSKFCLSVKCHFKMYKTRKWKHLLYL